MKIIITFCIIILALSCSNICNAQFGIKGGPNISNLRSGTGDKTSMVGFHIGGLYYLKIVDNLFLQPQLLVSYEPTKIKYNSAIDDDIRRREFTQKGVNASTPILLSYKFDFKDNKAISIDAGGYLSCGLFGDEKINNWEKGVHSKQSNSLFPDNRERFEYGLATGINYHFKEYLLSGSLKYGLNTINYHQNKTLTFMFSFGYIFQ